MILKLAKQGIIICSALVAMSTYASGSSLYGVDMSQKLADADKDGVINVRDMCPNTPMGAKVDNNGCSEKSSKLLSLDLKILFSSGKYDVKPQYYGEIKKLADFLKANPTSSVVIEGHTDDVGNANYNLALSQNRADAIANVLVERFGIPRSRVEGIGYGEEKPIATNDTASGRELNRRVVGEVFARKTADIERWNIYSVDTNRSLFSGR
ncbi:OmpA family protein [Marinomonas piezotolerans]|uniref:OmpA family protein n=2 Tax=Marinomonas piezotolerans TaxID=2213058 RepID=A0A370UD32_9GAMM|nr:OmpA family protein [Marinomonas piezotolerans]